MPVPVEPAAPQQLSQANLNPRGPVHPSPADWRDQILYFLLPDRFSDGQEGTRPLFDRADPLQHQAADKAAWMQAGTRFQGGNLAGLRQQLPYLKALGVTALWIGPIWKQRGDLETYHGYGIQNFLEIDPRFGTRQDLRDLVDAAHGLELYVILDIIYNHTGNNWFYDDHGQHRSKMPYRFQPPYPMFGWRSGTGTPVQSIGALEDGAWPAEFQNPDWYTRAGEIHPGWDPEPWENALHPDTRFRRGDFFDLKDLKLSENDHPSAAVLSALIRVYQYWVALSDCDGFRIDTVKHVPFAASRHFCGGIREYTESIGKENFLLLGEVTGGAGMARDYLDIFGRNLDATLDIGDPTHILEGFVKGQRDPDDFFRQFGGHDAIGSHRVVGQYHVSILDDHDMVGRNRKERFAAGNTIAARYAQAAHAVGVQLTTLGIPCIYYGTEQALPGSEADHDAAHEPLVGPHANEVPTADRYIREAMFGGTFGAFGTEGCHFFDPNHPTYLRIAAIARVVKRRDRIGMALRRGRQYSRETRFDGPSFVPPRQGELVAWSRILFDQEVVVALNTHGTEDRGADVTIEASFHPVPSTLQVLYRSDWTDAQLKNPPANQTAPVAQVGGRVTVRVDLPPAGMAILA